MFDVDAFVVDLIGCLDDPEPRRAAKAVMDEVMATPDAVADALAPKVGGLQLLHHTPELTVINIVWPPHMRLMPHDHRMWALIGIYAGIEDNQFYRRDPADGLDERSHRRLEVGDVTLLGSETIHSVTNPVNRLTGGLHVYGGDFVNHPRSQWGPGDTVERPYDMADVNRQFREANVAAGLAAGGPS